MKNRLYYFDNIKTFVIVAVVYHHVLVRTGGFQVDPLQIVVPEISFFIQTLFGLIVSFQQGYLMGLLFLISGYFLVGSYDRRGFKPLMKERLIRLGIPTLIYMLFVTPFMYGVFGNFQWFDFGAGFFPTLFRFISGCGIMWYTETLLVFSFIYGIVRLIRRRERVNPAKQIQYSPHKAWALIFIIAVFAFAIRQAFPIGKPILGIMPAYYSSYIALFIVGIIAYNHNILESISFKQGVRWLAAGLVLGTGGWLLVLYLGGSIAQGMGLFFGGPSWQCAAYALWESFVAVSMCLGIIPVFREKFNSKNKFLKTMAEDSFAVYVFHYPLVIAGVLLFIPFPSFILVKAIVVSILCVPLSFVLSHYVFRRIPLLKKVM